MAKQSRDLRIMVDANVLVAGTAWPRWPYAILRHAVASDFQLLLSDYVIEEARKHIDRVAPVRLPYFESLLQQIDYETTATPPIAESHHNLSRDPKDIPVALAAISARVECLVSYDKDLTESEELKRILPVILPAVFLRDYLGWTSEQLEAIRHRNWTDL